MNGTLNLTVTIRVDNDWDCKDDTIRHIKGVIIQELTKLEAHGTLGRGVTFDYLDDDWNNLEYKDEHDQYMDYLMATDPRV